MNYYIDTDFLEGTQKEKFPISLFRKNTVPTIDLISIGIVAEDSREYYAISKDFNLDEAWNRFQLEETSPAKKYMGFYEEKVYWLRDNLLKTIWRDLYFRSDASSGLSKNQSESFYQEIMRGEYDQYFTYRSIKNLIAVFGKTNKQIAEDIKDFCSIGTAYSTMDKSIASVLNFREQDEDVLAEIKKHNLKYVFDEKPVFYAYYADYDWVAFCWLFGKMMDLPDGFPKYCKDLNQILDYKIASINERK